MSSAEGIENWYAGKNLFITGATGFVGSALVEKILRRFSDVGDIYLLMRPKRGKEIQQRLEDFKKNSAFTALKESHSIDDLFSKKIRVVAGDVGQPDLGLSAADRAMLTEKVNVIFHSAATLDFEDNLKQTVDVNLLGTRRVVELGKQCQNLKAFVHVSSAYANAFRLNCQEVLYPLFKQPEEILDLVEKLSEKELEERTPSLLGGHPNTYTFTKHMAEFEVQKAEELFPCTIVRPSMIIGAWKEPMPGWTISKNGPQGFFMGAAKGVIRRLPVSTGSIYDYIPVDFVLNQLLVAGFHAGVTKTKTVTIYHCTSSSRKPFRWILVEHQIDRFLHTYPLKSAVWYPHLKLLPSMTRFRLSVFFVHIIPAFFWDLLTRVMGGKPILLKLHKKVNSSLDTLEKFIFTEWIFNASKTDELHFWLNLTDQRNYNLDVNPVEWTTYFNDLIYGSRVYLNKEPLANLEAAKTKDNILLVLHIALQMGIFSLIWWLFSFIFGASMMKTAFVVPVFYGLFCLL